MGEIDALPGIGAVIAQRIVDERRRHGAFRSSDELARRVDGLGPARLRVLRSVLSFALPSEIRMAPARSADWKQNLRALMALMPGDDAMVRLVALVERLGESGSAEPSPTSRTYRQRPPPPPPVAEGTAAGYVSVLASSDYHAHLPTLIAAATEQIAMAMFHIAMPGEDHPTVQLIDALFAAQARGVPVQVLIDRDRESDPYRSTVINHRAAQRLAAGGVDVRHDSPDRLLHSKFLVIDDTIVVLGSHNWSAGSYFDFDDLSVALSSPPLAGQLRARFDALFATATPV